MTYRAMGVNNIKGTTHLPCYAETSEFYGTISIIVLMYCSFHSRGRKSRHLTIQIDYMKDITLKSNIMGLYLIEENCFYS